MRADHKLKELAELYADRQKEYGNNYLEFGNIMHALFPEGLRVDNAHDWNRLGIFIQIVSKLTRYKAQYRQGGHEDSLDDLAVYTTMLQEIDQQMRDIQIDKAHEAYNTGTYPYKDAS